MSVGDVAGLIAAIAFVLLVGFLAVPLLKLGRVLDETRTSVKEITDHTVPVLDETATLVASSNTQLENIDTVTTAAAQVSENVSALTSLFAATVGGPMIKAAAFSYGVRTALSGTRGERAPGPMMARRLTWLVIGVVLTVVVVRKGRSVVDAYLPAGTTDAIDGAQRVSRAVASFRSDFLAAMAEREQELRARPRRRRRRRGDPGGASRTGRRPQADLVLSS